MNYNKELTIVMPCLNEAETLAVCIEKAFKSIRTLNLDAEVVIADNGSSDGSQAIARQHGARVVDVSQKGYGAALQGGIKEAQGKYIIMGDADGSYDFSNIAPFVEKLRAGYDLVMGCRLPVGGGTIMPGAMPLKHRYLGNPVLSFLGRLFFKAKVTDFHCGLRGFSAEAAQRMNLHTLGMEYASEMVIKATYLGMEITEVPITLYKDGRSRPPHLRSWRDGWRHLRFMLMYSPRWLFLTPGVALLGLGALSFLLLIRGPVSVGDVTFDTNSLLISTMLILLGVQIIMFYFFIKTFAITEKLLPSDKFLNRLYSVFRLETGLVLGTVLLLVGAGYMVASVYLWWQTGFQDLSYPESLRKVIPSIMFIVLGVQTIFSSFIMSILGLKR